MNKITNQNASKTFVLPQYRGVGQMLGKCWAITKFFNAPVDIARLQKKIGVSLRELSDLIHAITGHKIDRTTLSHWANEAKLYRPRSKYRIGDDTLEVIKQFLRALVMWLSRGKLKATTITGRMMWRVKVVKI